MRSAHNRGNVLYKLVMFTARSLTKRPVCGASVVLQEADATDWKP